MSIFWMIKRCNFYWNYLRTWRLFLGVESTQLIRFNRSYDQNCRISHFTRLSRPSKFEFKSFIWFAASAVQSNRVISLSKINYIILKLVSEDNISVRSNLSRLNQNYIISLLRRRNYQWCHSRFCNLDFHSRHSLPDSFLIWIEHLDIVQVYFHAGEHSMIH